MVKNLRDDLIANGAKQPFDIFNICTLYDNLKIRTCPFVTQGLRGMAVVADNPDDINCILVNSNLSYEEQNFYGSHELMHIYSSGVGSGQTFNCYDKVKPFQDSYVEWVANEGAAELLVPYEELLKLIEVHYNKMIKGLGTYEFCCNVAPKFAVTPIVIQNRLNSLCYEIEQYINGTPLDRIKIMSKSEQHKHNIFISSLNELESERLLKSFKAKIS